MDVRRRARRSRPLAQGDHPYVFQPDWRQQHEVVIPARVARPGAYPITEGVTRLSDVVTAAGGFGADADLSSLACTERAGPAVENDVEPPVCRGSSRGDPHGVRVMRCCASKLAALRGTTAESGSRCAATLPASTSRCATATSCASNVSCRPSADGEVRNPAILTYRPGATVPDYVKQAGGFTPTARVGKVRVTRAVNGQTLLARNVRTPTGDFIWAPERPDITVWQQGREVLTALAQIADRHRHPQRALGTEVAERKWT